MKSIVAFCLAVWAFPLWAQLPPAQPQTSNWFAEHVEFEVRLRGVATATNPSPVVHTSVLKFPTLAGNPFNVTIGCWRTTSSCQQVVAATVRVFIRLPWNTRANITKYVLCSGTECMMPAFSPMTAKVGESYSFKYDRTTAKWVTVPSVVVVR